jgi:hypothetical protein
MSFKDGVIVVKNKSHVGFVSFLLGAFLILGIVSAPSVLADDCKDGKCPPPPPERSVCFNVFCTFQRQDAGTQGESTGHYQKCQVASTFTHWVTGDGNEVWDNSTDSFNPAFEVQCDNEVIYNGSAHRYTDYLGTRLQAIPGPYPAVDLPKDSLREIRHYSDASLEFADQSLQGTCYIYTGPQ